MDPARRSGINGGGGSERDFVLTATKDLVHTAFNYTRSPRPRRLPRRRQPRD